MKPIDLVVLVIVAAVLVVAVRRFAGIASGKKGCCEGGGSGATTFPKAHITDTDESHYPYEATLAIDGMHCENCAKNVTNALDSVAGTWARVDLSAGSAHILCKDPIDKDAYRRAVTDAGYHALNFS